jgi:2-iminobutanoate/2-iminopropanoate deaminase
MLNSFRTQTTGTAIFIIMILALYSLVFAQTKEKHKKGRGRMQFRIINTDQAPEAVGTYSQGIEVDGTYYFSGQIGIDPVTNQMQPTIETQLNQILKNVNALLESEGLTPSNIVKSTIFLTDLNNFAAVNNAYTDFFQKPYPARSCVEVSKLPKDALVEIEVIAHR